MPQKMPSNQEIQDDLQKWCNKLNTLMFASSEGEAPQVLKSILAKHLFDMQNKEFQQQSPELYRTAQDLIQQFFKTANIRMIKTQKEMEDYVNKRKY